MYQDVTPRTPSTPHQRLYARVLMNSLDLDTGRITAMHERYFDAAKIAVPEQGSDVDAVLCGLTRIQASNLIGALQKEVEDD